MTYNDYDHFIELEEGNRKPWTRSKILSSDSLQRNLIIRIPVMARPLPLSNPFPLPQFNFSLENIHYAVVFLTCFCLLSLPYVAIVG